MRARRDRWLTVQQTAPILNSTCAEVCRLLSLGRLSGSKCKQPGRAGKAQWLIDPKSIAKEQRSAAKRTAQRAAQARRRKSA